MIGRRLHGTIAVLALLAATSAVVGPLASTAGAATFNVTNNHDAGAGSLRQALLDAAGAAGNDTVVVQAGLGTITLSTPIQWNASGANQAVTINREQRRPERKRPDAAPCSTKGAPVSRSTA